MLVAMDSIVDCLAVPNPTAKIVTSSPPFCELALRTDACSIASSSPVPLSAIAAEHVWSPSHRPPSEYVHAALAGLSRVHVCCPSVSNSMMRLGDAPVTASFRVLPLTSSSRPKASPLEMDVHPLARWSTASGPFCSYSRIVSAVSAHSG